MIKGKRESSFSFTLAYKDKTESRNAPTNRIPITIVRKPMMANIGRNTKDTNSNNWAKKLLALIADGFERNHFPFPTPNLNCCFQNCLGVHRRLCKTNRLSKYRIRLPACFNLKCNSVSSAVSRFSLNPLRQ